MSQNWDPEYGLESKGRKVMPSGKKGDAKWARPCIQRFAPQLVIIVHDNVMMLIIDKRQIIISTNAGQYFFSIPMLLSGNWLTCRRVTLLCGYEALSIISQEILTNNW